jgi:hypothetical protein
MSSRRSRPTAGPVRGPGRGALGHLAVPARPLAAPDPAAGGARDDAALAAGAVVDLSASRSCGRRQRGRRTGGTASGASSGTGPSWTLAAGSGMPLRSATRRRSPPPTGTGSGRPGGAVRGARGRTPAKRRFAAGGTTAAGTSCRSRSPPLAGASPGRVPPFGTNRMPASAARSPPGARPPFGRGGRDGRRGADGVQEAPGTRGCGRAPAHSRLRVPPGLGALAPPRTIPAQARPAGSASRSSCRSTYCRMPPLR